MAPAPPAAGAGEVTLPGLLLQRVDASPTGVAMRQKELGIWREISWSEYADRAADIGLGLVELGVRAGERVAIQSSNRYEWLLTDAAVQGIGAVSVGLYPSSPSAQVEALLRHSESMVLIAENEEQLDKVLEARGSLANLEKVVVIDTRGIRQLTDPMVVSLHELEATGRQRGRQEWAERVRALDPDDTAAIVYTTGATGVPKGAMLTHRNLSTAGATTAEAFGAHPSDDLYSYLPMSHAVERVCSSAAGLQAGCTVNFGEGAQSFAIDIAEVQPTIFLGVPGVWEQMATGVEARMAESGRIQRWAYNVWTKSGARSAPRRQKGGGPGLKGRLGSLEINRSLRKKLGLQRARVAVSTAAPVAPEAVEFFWSIGVPVREGYGITEFTGLATLNPADDVRVGTVGVPLRGVEADIRSDGEIALRGPTVFKGYFRDRGTTPVVDSDGWLLTGDLGEVDDGYLAITGRKKSLILTAGGSNVSPAALERRLVASPFIARALVVDCDDRLGALIQVEPATVAPWARERDLVVKGFADLIALPEVREMIDEVVADVNGEVSDVEQLARFELLTRQLDEADGHLTAIGEIRRDVVTEAFADEIAALRSGSGESP
ncbi:MAG: AMP-binding protein [Acidimicrobiia bacterium]